MRLKFAKNQAWPQLDVVGSYGWTGLDRTFNDAVDRLQEGEAPAWQLGINGSVPLGGVQGRAQIEAAKARKAQAIIRIKQAELEIGLSVKRSVVAIRNSQQALSAAKATSNAAKDLVTVGLKRMEAGQLSNFELIEQQRRLYDARSVELQFQAALNKAITELWLATGTVLDNLGVVYEDTVDERSLWNRVTQPPLLAKPYLAKDGNPPPAAPAKEKAAVKPGAPVKQSPAAPRPEAEKPPAGKANSIIKPARFAPRKPLFKRD